MDRPEGDVGVLKAPGPNRRFISVPIASADWAGTSGPRTFLSRPPSVLKRRVSRHSGRMIETESNIRGPGRFVFRFSPTRMAAAAPSAKRALETMSPGSSAKNRAAEQISVLTTAATPSGRTARKSRAASRAAWPRRTPFPPSPGNGCRASAPTTRSCRRPSRDRDIRCRW